MSCELGCQLEVQRIFKDNSKITSLLTSQEGFLHGITVDCKNCDSIFGIEKKARAYALKDPLQITLCHNRIKKNEIEEVLIHELIHIYDYLNGISDFSTCNGVAYSEVRAARESECQRIASIFGRSIITKQCVKINASRSTSLIYPNQGHECVNDILDKAIIDMRPFI